jgi:hypothetical protein
VTFSRQILTGLAGGILTGLFFGERAAALKWAADGFVKLLQTEMSLAMFFASDFSSFHFYFRLLAFSATCLAWSGGVGRAAA